MPNFFPILECWLQKAHLTNILYLNFKRLNVKCTLYSTLYTRTLIKKKPFLTFRPSLSKSFLATRPCFTKSHGTNAPWQLHLDLNQPFLATRPSLVTTIPWLTKLYLKTTSWLKGQCHEIFHPPFLFNTLTGFLLESLKRFCKIVWFSWRYLIDKLNSKF